MAIYVAIHRKTTTGYTELAPKTHADQVEGLGAELSALTLIALADVFGSPDTGDGITWDGEHFVFGSVASTWESLTGTQPPPIAHNHTSSTNTAVAAGDQLVMTDVSNSDTIKQSSITFQAAISGFLNSTGAWSYPTASDVGAAADDHDHGNLTSTGKIGSVSDKVIVTTTDGLLTTEAQNGAFNVNFGTTVGTACQGNDVRLSDSRPASDVYDWAKAISKPEYTYVEVGAAASNHNHSGVYAPATHNHNDTYYTETEIDQMFTDLIGAAPVELDTLAEISAAINDDENLYTTLTSAIALKEDAFTKNGAFNKNFGNAVATVCVGNDPRLSDARTPVSHNNTYHSETYITGITKAMVEAVLTGAITTHTHAYDNYSSWTLRADSGTDETVNSGEVVDIAGGSGISTSKSGLTVTIDLDTPTFTGDTLTLNNNIATGADAFIMVDRGSTGNDVGIKWSESATKWQITNDGSSWYNLQSSAEVAAAITARITDTATNGSTDAISSNWAYDNVKTPVPTGAVFTDTNTWRGIDDTPVNGQTAESISSNWAYDHKNSSTAHYNGMPAGATELSSSINLDTLQTAGFWYQTANADTTGNNYPSGEAGSLLVQRSAGTVTQMYITYSTSNPRMYIRTNYSSTWSAWKEVSANTITPVDETPTYEGYGVAISSDWAYGHSTSSTGHPRDERNSISTHTHGNIVNDGRMLTTTTIAANDRLIVRDNDNDQMVAALAFGSGTTTFLANNGTWQTPVGTVYSHPTHPGDDFSVDTGALTGAWVVSDIDINVTTDTSGHVTDANGSVSTRQITLGDLGYTGATNANYYTLPAASATVRGGAKMSYSSGVLTIDVT